jgi:hypothetical protein
MLSMRACQDFANAQFFLFILYIDNFPFTIFKTAFSKISMEFDCDITSCHIYLHNSHLMFYCYCGVNAKRCNDIFVI